MDKSHFCISPVPASPLLALSAQTVVPSWRLAIPRYRRIYEADSNGDDIQAFAPAAFGGTSFLFGTPAKGHHRRPRAPVGSAEPGERPPSDSATDSGSPVLLDLTLVTKALAELLRAHIRRSPAWPFTTYGQPLVTCRPPDLLAPGTLGVHLYHSTEEPYLKNQATADADPIPMRVVPMALALYYQFSAVGVGIGEAAAAQEKILIDCVAEP